MPEYHMTVALVGRGEELVVDGMTKVSLRSQQNVRAGGTQIAGAWKSVKK
jgi:hypothetical protein